MSTLKFTSIAIALAATHAHAQPEEPAPAPVPGSTGAITVQLGTQGLGVELHFDVIPYVQLGVAGAATFEKERARIFLRGRQPLGGSAQLVAGVAYNRGYYKQQSECGFLDHSCNNEILLEGRMRGLQFETGLNYTPGRVRLTVLAGVERLWTKPICPADGGACLVDKTSVHVMVGVGIAF